MNVYFSDFFNVNPDTIENYGAFNISLIKDLPLFIDPFLLFNSGKKEYQDLHSEILRYVAFLRDQSIAKNINDGLLKSWYCFPEVKQTWFGYSEVGNGGRGPGIEFARALNDNLNGIFSGFDKNTISRSSHLEKLCLIKENTGRDSISDFVTNLIKGYLLKYTQEFAKQFIDKAFLRKFSVRHITFNYATLTWSTEKFLLPAIAVSDAENDYVLLTPKDLLTKDDTWINRPGLVNQFDDIVSSISNDELRAQLNFYFSQNLPKPEYTKKGKEKAPKKQDIVTAVNAVISKYPELLDYYIRFKEDHGDEARFISEERVEEIHNLFVADLSSFIEGLAKETRFYDKGIDTLAESYDRALFLKAFIESKDGYRIFYRKNDVIRRETDLQIMYRLTWFAIFSDVTREANEGRGPVDFKISRGAKDKTLVEFKLASNSKLRQNLENQVEVYKKAHDTDKAIKVIIFFSLEEEAKVKKILEELGLGNEKYVILIDARKDNKISASKVK